jgi:lipid-binding SYLF domain-containing protein
LKELAMNITRRTSLGLVGAAVLAPRAHAQAAEQELVDQARLAVDAVRREPEMGEAVAALLNRAKGVVVIPSLLKAGLIFGGEGGSGVVLSRDANGQWSSPAFVTLGSASFGFQLGVQNAQVLFVIMTDKGMQQVIKSQFKLGADASIAIGPIGRGVEAATTAAVGADIYAYSKVRGLFGGATLEGSVIYNRADWNRAYYGREVSAAEIVLERKAANRNAEALAASLR